MLVPNQLIEIKIGSANFQFYKNLGYEFKKFDILHVPPSELKDGSHAHVTIICDECGVHFEREYRAYLKRQRNGKDYCEKCSDIFRKQTMIEKYGVAYPLQNERIKEKTKQSNLEKYGVENVSQAYSIIEKRKQTFVEKYGYENPGMVPEIQQKNKQYFLDTYGCENPFMLDEVKEKIKQTNLEKYGVEYSGQSEMCKQKVIATNMEKYGVPYSMQCPEVRQKAILTNIERYGYPSAIQNPEIKQKVRQALMENGTGKASAQQKQVHTMVQEKYPEAQLNYPVAPFSLDVFICVNDVKIDIEYDGSHWHQDQQRDIKRDKTLQSQGFKTIRIRSGRLVPSKQELFDAIDCLANTDRRFIEIILSDWKKEEGEECQRQLQAHL